MASFSGNSRVTDQIMEYYLKFGQNRDLEKFLRLRANTTRSSSDGSIPTSTGLEEVDRRGGKVGRSMENLSTLRKQEQEEERDKKSAELLNASGGSEGKLGQKDGEEKKKKLQAGEEEKMVVKETKSEKKSGRNFNFNLESVIEIKLPPVAVQQQPIVISPPQGMLAPASVIHEISTAGTQTMPEARSVEQQTEEPIRPILKPTGAKATLNPEDTVDTTRDLSPVSSVASTKQKLEWDSLGDIGYNSSDKFYFCGAADLNATEKRCLQKYFTRKGLSFDEKVVVVRNVQTPKKDQKLQEDSGEKSKVNVKHKWLDVYQKYKDKYPNPSETSLGMMNPDAQSTPKVTSLQNVPQKLIKSTQTSLVKILTKGIQAEQIVDTSDKQIGTETLSSTTNKTTSGCEQVEVAESFEFFSSPPSEHREGAEESSRNGIKVIPSSAGNSLKSSSDNSSSLQQQLSSSGGSGSGRSRGEYKFEDELRLGMTLYNTICESKSLPTRVKQSLIDKIFRKMMKNDPKGRTKEQLLWDCVQAKQQQLKGRDEKGSEGETAMSGVELIGESGKSSSVGRSSRGVDEVVVEILDDRDGTEKTASSSEDPIVQNLEELSTKSNEARNPARRVSNREQSVTSSQRTLSSHPNSSNHTAQRISQPTPISTGKSSPSSGQLTSDDRIRKAMEEYLKPMTLSEVDYANQQGLKLSLQRAKERKKLETASAFSTGNKIVELFRKEKQSQLLKIDKKIEHLKTMKLLLLEEQKTVNEIGVDTRTTYPLEQKSRPPPLKPSDDKENLYENTERRAKSAASAPVYTSVHEDSPIERSNNGTEFTSSSRSESGWNSHYHMKKMIQNRSKLETPTFDESIATFIQNRKDKFIENYERHRRQMFEEQHHIYTKPYSGRQSKQDHYSRLDEKYSVRNIAKSKTNLPRSDGFISSDSMSIPAANTLTNTTTHQYDIKSSRASSDSLTLNARPAATQTTGSIMKTKPIFESKSKISTTVQVPSQPAGCNCASNCPCRHRLPSEPSTTTVQHTKIIDDSQPKQDKQQQTKPNSIAYVITFQGEEKQGRRKLLQSEKEQVYHRETISTDVSSSTNRSSTDASDLLPLKEQFRRNRPGTLLRLKERQMCVNELNKLRAERNKQRKKLLLLTSDESLKRCDAKERLPPPPLAQRRIFSSKTIRENTRRQFRNLPEVLRKKEIEKVNNIKRKNLILRDKFNRNLQRKVLHGQVDLSNSVRVMQV